MKTRFKEHFIEKIEDLYVLEKTAAYDIQVDLSHRKSKKWVQVSVKRARNTKQTKKWKAKIN